MRSVQVGVASNADGLGIVPLGRDEEGLKGGVRRSAAQNDENRQGQNKYVKCM